MFGKTSEKLVPSLGKSSISNLIINSIIPMQYLVGNKKDDEKVKAKALEIIRKIPSENNRVIRMWNDVGIVW